MRTRRLLVVIAVLAAATGALVATANAVVLPTYTGHSEYLLDLTYPYPGGGHYYHRYSVDVDCLGAASASGRYVGQVLPGTTQYTETVTNWVQTATTISFTSDYDINTYQFTFAGVVNGAATWVGGGSSNGGQTFPNGSMILTRTSYAQGEPCFEAPTTSCAGGAVFVSAVGSGEVTTPVSRPVLAGCAYNVTASGTYYAGGDYQYDIQADAEYSQDAYQRLNSLGWTDTVHNYGSYGEGLLELKIDGGLVEWGPFSASHVYTIPWTASSSQVEFQFQIYDVFAQNNTGGLCVALEQTTFRSVSGFYRPVDMGDVWNVVKGGSTVPLKFEAFECSGDELTDVASLGAGFALSKVACPDGMTTDSIETLATAGGTVLRYDPDAGQFIQNWKTPTTKGCYKVNLTSAYGDLTANFKIR